MQVLRMLREVKPFLEIEANAGPDRVTCTLTLDSPPPMSSSCKQLGRTRRFDAFQTPAAARSVCAAVLRADHRNLVAIARPKGLVTDG